MKTRFLLSFLSIVGLLTNRVVCFGRAICIIACILFCFNVYANEVYSEESASEEPETLSGIAALCKYSTEFTEDKHSNIIDILVSDYGIPVCAYNSDYIQDGNSKKWHENGFTNFQDCITICPPGYIVPFVGEKCLSLQELSSSENPLYNMYADYYVSGWHIVPYGYTSFDVLSFESNEQKMPILFDESGDISFMSCEMAVGKVTEGTYCEIIDNIKCPIIGKCPGETKFPQGVPHINVEDCTEANEKNYITTHITDNIGSSGISCSINNEEAKYHCYDKSGWVYDIDENIDNVLVQLSNDSTILDPSSGGVYTKCAIYSAWIEEEIIPGNANNILCIPGTENSICENLKSAYPDNKIDIFSVASNNIDNIPQSDYTVIFNPVLTEQYCGETSTPITITYTITYNLGGGTGCSDETYTPGMAKTLSCVPTKSGYTFMGWYNSATGGNQLTQITALDTGNKIFYAQWVPNTYTVTLDNQGATSAGTTNFYYQYKTNTPCYYYTSSTSFTQSTCMGSDGYTITLPTRTGYKFDGYFTGTNGSGTQYVDANGTCINNIYSSVAGNTTLYAKWTLNSITCPAGTYLPKNGAECITCPLGYACTGGIYVLNTASDQGLVACNGLDYADETGLASCKTCPTAITYANYVDITQYNEGYRFYSTPDECEALDGTMGYDNCKNNISGVCYAYFTAPIDNGTNNGVWCDTRNNNEDYGTFISSKIDGGYEINYCRVNAIQCNNGYHISSVLWNSIAEDYEAYVCSNNAYPTSSEYMWLPNINSIKTEICVPDASDTSVVDFIAARSGERGHYICGDCPNGTVWDENAKQCKAYEVSCSAGEYLPANVTQCSECPANSYCGGGTYTFSETNTQGKTSCPTGATSPAGSTSIEQCVVSTANIIYNYANGGSGCANDTYTLGVAKELTCIPTKDGYTFVGWYNSATGGNKITQITAIDTGDKTFYAQWTPNTITCLAGAYLPANATQCSECPANSYCSGGTYTFSETNTGGITSCPSGYSLSSAGATSMSDCYTEYSKQCSEVNPVTTGGDTHIANVIYANEMALGRQTAISDTEASEWKINNTDACNIVNMTCDNGYHYSNDIINLDPSIDMIDRGYIDIDDTTEYVYNADKYGIIEDKTWVDEFEYGTLHGKGLCSSENGYYTTDTEKYHIPSTEWTNYYIKSNPVNDGGYHCWCQLNGYTPVGGTKIDFSSRWVYLYGYSDNNYCIHQCAQWCSDANGQSIRKALFHAVNSCQPNTYTITYNLDGGTNYTNAPSSYTIESETIILGEPTKTGYTFDGWCDNSGLTQNCNMIKTIPTGSTGNKTYYAKWTKVGCPSGFVSDEELITDINTQCYQVCTTTDKEHSAEVSGKKYYDDTNTCEIISCVNGYELKDGICEPSIYTISYFDGESVITDSGNPTSYTYGTETVINKVATKAGYVFIDWCTDSELTECAETQTITATETGNKTYYAQWTIAVVHCDAGYYLPANSTTCQPCKTNGTYCDAGDYAISNQNQGILNCPIPDNITGALVINYNASQDFNDNGVYDSVEECTALFVQTQYGDVWGTEIIQQYDPDNEFNQNIAQWYIYCKYNLDTNSYKCTPSTAYQIVCAGGYYIPETTVESNAAICDLNFIDGGDFDNEKCYNTDLANMTNPCIPAQPGYYTTGYDKMYEDELEPTDLELLNKMHGLGGAALGNEYFDMFANEPAPLDDQYAKCPQEYPNSDAGAWTINMCYRTCPSKDGYTLVSEDREYYNETNKCEYVANTYTITYELNGGSGCANETYTLGTAKELSCVPTRTGYTFNGWYDAATGGNKITQITALDIGDKTFYAQWTAEEYTITYELDGGTNNPVNPTSYTIESETIILNAPTKANYTFDGWVDGNSNTITSIPTGSTGNTTLTAQWSLSVVYCDAGYYLPSNSIECQVCSENHYCEGGDYIISAEYDAGIELCPDGTTSPEGTSGAGGCGKILHVGDNIIYLTTVQETTPALAVRIEDKVYYARTTPVSEGVKPMHKDSIESLRVNVDNTEYSIHDNTIKGEQ